MTTTHNPQNQTTSGGATDLGQITRKTGRNQLISMTDSGTNETRLYVTYYGQHFDENQPPENTAQIALHLSQWSTSVYFTPPQLRQLAAALSAAALLIEETVNDFNEAKRYQER